MRHTFTLDSIHKTYISQISLFTLRKNAQPQVKKALSGVSITLTPGLYGLLGPNGAGKSTLIHIITGTLAPDSGEVLWCGKPASGITFRRILGYMPQQQGLYDSYTGRRFLAYMAALKEIPRKAVAAEVDRVAAAVNLTAELDKRLSAYSGGMKQRLLLASALLGNPKLLILDEPTAGLDPKNASVCASCWQIWPRIESSLWQRMSFRMWKRWQPKLSCCAPARLWMLHLCRSLLKNTLPAKGWKMCT